VIAADEPQASRYARREPAQTSDHWIEEFYWRFAGAGVRYKGEVAMSGHRDIHF
jgi:hypothetical protein